MATQPDDVIERRAHRLREEVIIAGRFKSAWRVRGAGASFVVAWGLAHGAAPTLEAVTVIDTSPLPGIGLQREQIPAPVQTLPAAALDDGVALDLTDLLRQRAGSVHINEVQNNPFQPDVSYRGFSASPLLGTPQGLSVYLDGVRLNQPFGEVVSWDLVPRAALKSITLMPGSNPLFGLNTLGGALVLQTKDGRSDPGTALQTYYGSHARRSAEFEHGGSNARGLHWFMSGTTFRERGWRDESPSAIGQAFGKVGWADARTDVALTVAYANNTLNGNGLQEVGMLERNYASAYTKPDVTDNRALLLNLTGRHELTENAMLSGNAYYRRIRTATFNGDFNDDVLTQSIYQPSAAERAALTAAGYTGFPTSGANATNTPFPFWRCIANVLLRDEPAEKCTGLINRTSTDQQNYGLAGQLSWLGNLGGARHEFTGGAAVDASRMDFAQTSQLGYVNPDRSITPVNAFGDGVTGGNVDGAPYDTRVDLNGRTLTWSVFASDTLTLAQRWHVTLAARYNHTALTSRDRIHPGGGANSLDGDHTFSRLNPAVGLSFAASPSLTAYASYNEGSRTPSIIELGCANPARPCRLPNAMAGDPPLRQVVTHTLEAGLHGRIARHTNWHAGVFHAQSLDDILFVASPTVTGFGYFRNFGETLRRGIELGADHRVDRWTVRADYTLLDATYRTPETLAAGSNSSNDSAAAGLPGNIRVQPGDRLPLVPRHLLKLGFDYRPVAEWTVGLTMTAVSGVYARGNENNDHAPNGVQYLGPGRTGGYAVFDFTTRYRATPQLALFGRIANLFDRRYATAAQLGPSAFGAGGGIVARPLPQVGTEFPLVHSTFAAPGAPRAGWVGIRYEFEKRRSSGAEAASGT